MNKKDERRRSTRDRERQRAEDNKYSGGANYLKLPDGVEVLEITEGTMELDFLPYEITKDVTIPISPTKDINLEKGDLNVRRTIFVHRSVGAENKSYLCPRTVKKKCPICEDRARLMKDYKANEELIRELKPQTKDLINVINLKDKKAGIQLFDFSFANFSKMLEEEIREGKEEYGGYGELEGGYTIRARFVGDTYKGRDFTKCTRIDFDERKDYKDDILDDVIDLEDILKVPTYEELERIYLEYDADDSKEKDDEEETGRSRGSRRSRDKDKDEESEEKEERSSRRSRKSKDEDDDPPERERERSSRRNKDKDKEEDEEKEERSSRRSRRGKEDEDEEKEEKSSRRSRHSKEDEDEDEEKEERSSRRSKSKKDKEEDDDECPHDHKFGKDCDKTDDCDSCKKWDDCRDEADRMKRKK